MAADRAAGGFPRTESLLVTIDEAAQLLACGRTLLKLMIRRGEIPIVKIGRLTRIPRTCLSDFVRQSMDGGEQVVVLVPPRVVRPVNRRGPVRRARRG
jgi:excisionase family DNA binding protein